MRSFDDLTSGARVAIVEDEALIAEELRVRLTRMGLEVCGLAATGLDAVRLAEQAQPSLMLMDIRLRGDLDGIDAAGQIVQRWQIPIVFLTAHSDDGTIKRARSVGPYGFLIKPIGDRDLRAAVTMALQRAALERRLRESEERYATTLASIGEGVIAINEQGRITFMNKVAEDLTLWPLDEAAGRDSADVIRLINGATREPVPDPVRRAFAEAHVVTLDEGTVLIRRDGSEVAVADSAAPIRSTLGEVRGGVMVFRDVTEELRTREALRASEHRLVEAQHLDSIGRLAGGVAHDINNAMMVVMGSSDLILNDPALRPEARPFVRNVRAAAERAAFVCQQLLAYGRRQVLRPEPLDANAVILSLRDRIRPVIGDEVELDLNLATNIGRCLADAGHLETVLINLCTNAREAMPKGGRLTISTGEVHVEAAAAESAKDLQPGTYIVITVSDSGRGIDPAIRDRIFEPFFTTKPFVEGGGLGLATCYGILKQSRGHITVDSTLGAGSTFKVYLPEAPSRAVATSIAEPLPRGGETILVVEDEAAMRSVIRLTLEDLGYTVITASSGHDAVDVAKQHRQPIDLLVTDVVMPVLNGWQVWERLSPLLPELRVLFISGYSGGPVVPHGIERHGLPLLPKPFSRSSLARTVRQVLDRPAPGPPVAG